MGHDGQVVCSYYLATRLEGNDLMKRAKLSITATAFCLSVAGASWAQESKPSGAPGGPGRSAGKPATEFENLPLAKNDAEKMALEALDAARQGPRYANVSPTDGRLLRLLTESVNAKRVVEIGTSTGESGIWFALALRTTGGKLLTHEIDPGRARTARENFRKAGVDDLVTVIEGDAHETVKQHTEPIDILFLDADKEGYLDYLDKLLPLIRPGGLIVAHNMRYPTPNPKYIEAITKNPDLDTSFLLMEGAGVGVTLKKR
jgi:predicted O-methyltransferase YrrM